MIIDLYTRNEQEIPNFTLIKNTFDAIDLRKDGIIDFNEWSKSFSTVNGKLDLEYEKYSNDINELKNIKNYKNELRKWENSDDITQKYLLIYKNRKLIKNKLSDSNLIIYKGGKQYTTSDNLIYAIQKILPNCKLSGIQWKMIANLGKSSSCEELLCISEFFRLIEISTRKSNNFQTSRSNSGFNKIFYGSFDYANNSLKDITTFKKNKNVFGNRAIIGAFSHGKNLKMQI